MNIGRSNTFLGARYRRLSSRRGPMKANVALQRTLLTIIWNMATTAQPYQELGADYYTRHNPDKTKNRAIKQLKSLGYDVSIEAAA